MPSLEDFLGKPKGSKRNWDGWEEIMGTYGCQKCDKESNVAYFNESTHKMMWVCGDNHESVVQL